MEERFAIILGGNGTTIVPVDDWSSEAYSNSTVRLSMDDRKTLYAPKSSTIITASLSLDEVMELAKQLSGDKPISHFGIQSDKKDLSEMVNDKGEELTEEKAPSLPSNVI